MRADESPIKPRSDSVRRAERVRLSGSTSEAVEWLYARGMTDGLPVVVPTEQRVQAMVESGTMAPQQEIGAVPPLWGVATAEKIAISAVMAGCLPSYMPVIVAALRALLDERFNLQAVQTTTNPVAPLLIVNGPIRQELAINTGPNVMGPGCRANATIGRAIRLILINLGGTVPGKSEMATQGMPGKYTFCIGENEEGSPWEPLHVERGFGREESTVTVVPACGTSEICMTGAEHAEDAVLTIPKHMVQIGSINFAFGNSELFLIMSPLHAKELARHGFTKQGLRHHLYLNCRAPLAWFAPQYREKVKDRIVGDEVTPACSEEQFVVVVSGSDSAPRSTFVPTFQSQSVTRKVALPEPLTHNI